MEVGLAVRSSERPEVVDTSPVSEPSAAEVANLVPDGASFVTSEGRGWRGLLLAHADVPAVDLPDFTSEAAYIGVWLSAPASVEWCDGAKWRRLVAMPGSVGVVPAGEPRGLRVAADHEIAVVFVPRAVIERELQEADVPARAAELVRGFGIPDPEIARIVSSLVSELRTGGGLGERLYVESLAAATSGCGSPSATSGAARAARWRRCTSGRSRRACLRRRSSWPGSRR
jgi:hypothetical protein